MKIRVSAVQMEFTSSSTPQELYDRISQPVREAVEQGAHLVAFPDQTGFMLLGAVLPEAANAVELKSVAERSGFESIQAMLRRAAPALRDFHVHLFSSVAKRFQVYIASGSVIDEQGGTLFKRSLLFSPDGSLVGVQNQTHRSQKEIAWNLQQGNRLQVFDIGIARVGLVVGEDVRYPEVSRILALQNANLLIHCAAYDAYHECDFLLDLWREVQSNQVFGLQACAIGMFRGRSAVYAPVEMTPTHSGMLARAQDADSAHVVTAELDFEALQRVVDQYPIFDFFNDSFNRTELLAAYHRSNDSTE